MTQTTAWTIKTKLAEVMEIAGQRDKLDRRIETDEAYLDGEHGGGKVALKKADRCGGSDR